AIWRTRPAFSLNSLGRKALGNGDEFATWQISVANSLLASCLGQVCLATAGRTSGAAAMALHSRRFRCVTGLGCKAHPACKETQKQTQPLAGIPLMRCTTGAKQRRRSAPARVPSAIRVAAVTQTGPPFPDRESEIAVAVYSAPNSRLFPGR